LVFLQACKNTSATSEPEIALSWNQTESPIFPDTWPPNENTIWVSYIFAYGVGPELMDGTRVSPPLAIKEWNSGITTETGNKMEVAAIQGVVPLDDASIAILETRDDVTKFCLSLSALPDPLSEQARAALAFYSTWFQYNSTILDWIRMDHAAFIEWVRQNAPAQ
jgi:hypothetical protein